MSKQVAILLVRELSKVLLRRRIQDVQSEPYFLLSEQYLECDSGVQLLADRAGDMIEYAKYNKLRPLGVVIVNDDGRYLGFFNEDAFIAPSDRKFAEKVFNTHVHFWFCEFPRLMRGQAEN
jgi:hypothetical protein